MLTSKVEVTTEKKSKKSKNDNRSRPRAQILGDLQLPDGGKLPLTAEHQLWINEQDDNQKNSLKLYKHKPGDKLSPVYRHKLVLNANPLCQDSCRIF